VGAAGTPPPKEFRFLPGQSGNPKGRPPRMKTWTTLLKKLDEPCPSDKKGKGRTWREAIVLATLKMALKGHRTALKILWDRMGEIIPLPLGLGQDGRPISIKVVYGEEGEDSSE